MSTDADAVDEVVVVVLEGDDAVVVFAVAVVVERRPECGRAKKRRANRGCRVRGRKARNSGLEIESCHEPRRGWWEGMKDRANGGGDCYVEDLLENREEVVVVVVDEEEDEEEDDGGGQRGGVYRWRKGRRKRKSWKCGDDERMVTTREWTW